jgi:adenylate cyclase
MNEVPQRKLAAIMCADVVGYSSLMDEDEIGTLTVLKTHRTELFNPKIVQFGGRVIKWMGDGALVEFTSIVSAVECSLEIQRALVEENGQIKLRIGVNLGDVIIEGDDIFGDGVNIAARLEALAEPGGICISDMAYQNIRKKLDARFIDFGSQKLKNIATPIQTWHWTNLGTESSDTTQKQVTELDERLSIAVLPFDNMSGDPEQEYFSDGISEDIITDLSKISALFVIARNSSFSYKGQTFDIRQISRELGVKYVVEGSVRKAGNRARITAQLIDAQTGGHIWAERFDGELSDIFALQDEITAKIVDALQLALLPSEKETIERVPTSNLQAYDLYLLGRRHLSSATRTSLVKAKSCFQKAIELDSNFARAYCGLADSGAQLFSEYEGDERLITIVFEAASMARQLEPDLAEAYASMGFALSGSMGKALAASNLTTTAEQEFAKAVELDVDSFEAHYYWARHCFEQGRMTEASIHFEDAWRISPREPKLPALLLSIYRVQNQTEKLIAAADKGLALAESILKAEPGDTRACMAASTALVELGRQSEAIEMMERAIEAEPADRIVRYNAACLFATIGDTERALEQLEIMGRTGLGNIGWIENDGDLDSLRYDPRFIGLLRGLSND